MRRSWIALVAATLLFGCSHGVNPVVQSLTAREGTPARFAGGASQRRLLVANIAYVYPLPRHLTGPNAVATGSDKNVWFTEFTTPTIGKITQSGAVTEYPIPSGNVPSDIAVGSSGTLWFTEGNAFIHRAGKPIGKITVDGSITEYRGPAHGQLFAIAKGPGGNMWFTDSGNVEIGYITPSGAIKEFALGGSIQPGHDIVAGSDGDLWFPAIDASGAGYIGKSTPTGTITAYPGPAGDVPLAIAKGPDGNVYASTVNGIWRVTPAGTITGYVPPPSSQYFWNDIIVGPDRRLWMSTSHGAIVEFDPKTNTFSNVLFLPGKYDPQSLTLGGDGDVWFSDIPNGDIFVYDEKLTKIGIRLNGEMSIIDPNYGFELGYAVGTKSTVTQTISVPAGESVIFENVDTIPHSAAFLGDATATGAPWPGSFDGSTTQSAAGTAIGTSGWATGSLDAGAKSPYYETGMPGFYMIGCQYHYDTNEMRTVIIVH